MAVFPETPDSATCASSDSVVRLLVGRRDSYPAPSRLRAFFMDRLRNEAHPGSHDCRRRLQRNELGVQ